MQSTGSFMGREWKDWVHQYEQSHQHPVNCIMHLFGIPVIVISLPLFLLLFINPAWWPLPTSLFVIGWLLQFTGHFVEKKPPEFFHDWRYILVGLRWWWLKISGNI